MKERQTSDILIIGGGVIGLSIARELRRKGAGRITVVDQSVCGRAASWAAAGMLGPNIEAQGGPFFDLCCESRDIYPQLAEELFAETGIDIELDRTGTLFVAFGDGDAGRLLEKCRQQSAAGIATEIIAAADLARLEPSLSTDIKIAAFYPDDWQVENRKLVAALRSYAENNDVELIENTRVDKLIVDGARVTGAETENGRVSAGQTVLATGAWTSLIKLGDAEMPFQLEPVRGQIIAFRPPRPMLRHVVESKYGYLVPRRDGRLLAGSTSEDAGFDHSTTDEAVGDLRSMAERLLPDLTRMEIADKWAGLRPFAADGLPVLGRVAGIDGLSIATAHYRNGILLAPVTARICADVLIDGVESEYFSVFRPDRFQPRGVGTGN